MNYWLHMLLFIFMNIAIASSWNIIGGYAGYISLGHNVFFAIGGYAAAILFAYFGVSPFIAFPLAGLIAMAIGFVVGLITLRTRGPTFIISTIALVLLTKILLDNWDYIGGTNGISLPLLDLPVELVKLPFYYLDAASRASARPISPSASAARSSASACAPSRRTRPRRRSPASRRALYKTLAFALSGLFIGMAGALWGYYLTYLSPVIFLSILVGAKFVLMTILGGRGTVSGPVVGAIALHRRQRVLRRQVRRDRAQHRRDRPAPDRRARVLPGRHHRHAEEGRPPAAHARLGLALRSPRNGAIVSTMRSRAWMCGAWPTSGQLDEAGVRQSPGEIARRAPAASRRPSRRPNQHGIADVRKLGGEVEGSERARRRREDGRIDLEEHGLALRDDVRVRGDEILGNMRAMATSAIGSIPSRSAFSASAEGGAPRFGKSDRGAEKHEPPELLSVPRRQRQRDEAAEPVSDDVGFR